MSWDLVIVSGGRGSRLGGADKGALTIDGVPLLDRALALAGEQPPELRLVAGAADDRPGVTVVRDPEPYAGPAAAVMAAAHHVQSPVFIALAVDMPGVSGATLERLLAVGTSAVLVDEDGRASVCAALVTAQVLDVAQGKEPPRSWRDLMAAVGALRVRGTAAELHDVDTPDDLTAWSVDAPIN